MKNFWKRLGSTGVAAALCLGMAQAVPAAVVSAADPLFSSECEDLTLENDAKVATDVYGNQCRNYELYHRRTGDRYVSSDDTLHHVSGRHFERYS